MSVRLDLFPETAVLRLGRAIGVRQVQVLAAGIRRVFNVGVKVVVVDARYAEFDDASVEAIRHLTPALCRNDQGVRMVIISRDKRVGDFRELFAALKTLESKQKAGLSEWFEAEDELDELLRKRAELETKLGDAGPALQARARKARGERVRAERLREGLAAALARWTKRLGAWRRRPVSAEAQDRLRKALGKIPKERKAS